MNTRVGFIAVVAVLMAHAFVYVALWLIPPPFLYREAWMGEIVWLPATVMGVLVAVTFADHWTKTGHYPWWAWIILLGVVSLFIGQLPQFPIGFRRSDTHPIVVLVGWASIVLVALLMSWFAHALGHMRESEH